MRNFDEEQEKRCKIWVVYTFGTAASVAARAEFLRANLCMNYWRRVV